MVERVVTQVNVVDASAASVRAAFASVAGVVLWTCVRHGHHDASAVASAVSSPVILTLDLEAFAAHRRGAAWALALAQVFAPAILADASLALWV